MDPDTDASLAFPHDAILIKYFYSGRSYKMILQRLKLMHGINKSMSWLKRQYRRLRLKRRCPDPPEETVKTLIKSIVDTSDCLRGYRSVWRILFTKYKVPVRRDTVMRLMKSIDPEGVQLRKGCRLKRRAYHSKGPNYIWHLDGYDKLTPYGLSVHGCIDGFSRKLVWLKLSTTNHDPKVISRFYLESVEKARGCPRVVRADHGTENCVVAKVHIGFRMLHSDDLAGSKSFIYGPSTANIRIEAWWSQLRRFKTHWWIDLCKGLQAEGHYDHSNAIHRYTLAFTVSNLLQEDLDAFVEEWNTHPIRKNRLASSPHGCPNDIYDMPTLYGARDHLQPIDHCLWASCMLHKSRQPPKFFPADFNISTDLILRTAFGITVGSIAHANCRNIYIRLVQLINELVSRGIPVCSALTNQSDLDTDSDSDSNTN